MAMKGMGNTENQRMSKLKQCCTGQGHELERWMVKTAMGWSKGGSSRA
jgi:hypothetical protein